MYSESHDPKVPSSFRVCESCGQLTPSQLPQCVNCGAVSNQSAVAEQQARAERRFLGVLFSRSTPVSYAILIFNILIFLLMSLTTGDNVAQSFIYGADPATLVAFGAKTNDLLQKGEWFRLVTPIFIHIGILHLGFNSYALWMIGPLVEKLYGSARFLLIYLLTGICGVIGSYFWQVSMQKPIGISAGASGAIFGLFGVLAVFGYKYRKELPPNFLKAIRSSVLPVIVINLIIGFSVPFIDNAAHIGGLISGALLTLLIPYYAPGRARISRMDLAILVICVAVIAYSFVRAYQASPQYVVQGSNKVETLLDNVTAAYERSRENAKAAK